MKHQYEAVNCIIDDFLESEELGLYRSHLISHVQGSGKSYTMLYASKILYSIYNCQIFLVVDKNNLEEQFFKDLNNIDEIYSNEDNNVYNKVDSGENLQGLVESGKPEIVLTTIQKFGSIDHNSISSSEDSCQVVFADEAHRFQSADLGSYMDAAFDNYYYYGFTGTPTDDAIEVFSKDRDENYLHSYSMGKAIDDGSILKVNVEERPVFFDFDYDSMNSYFEDHTEDFSEIERRRLIDSVGKEDIESAYPRIKAIVEDLVDHYISNVKNKNMKAMVVTYPRKKASLYGDILNDLFSNHPDLDKEEVGVLFSDYGKKDSSSDELVESYGKSKREAIDLRENFGDSDENPKIVVVCDMLLTGFDAPILKTVYLDRNFNDGHNLLQTIARTNRTRDNKKFGEIIDYCGVTQNFEEMIEYNTEEIEKFKTKDKTDFVEEFEDKILQIRDYYFSDDVVDSYNNVERFLDELDSVVKQGNFVKEFEELRTLYENLRPHKSIAKYSKEYKLYEKIYQVYSNSVEENKNKAVIKENKDIVEKAIEENSESRVEDTVREFEIKGLGSNNSVKVTEKYVEVKEFMRSNREKLPEYEKLSERVKELVESEWDSDEISNEKAIEELERIYDDIEKKKIRFENSDLSPSQEIFRSIIESKENSMSSDEIKDKAISIEESLSDKGYDNLSRFGENDIKKLKSDIIDILGKEKCLTILETKDISKMVDKYIGTN
jgi:type I restriction enzyme R subunit